MSTFRRMGIPGKHAVLVVDDTEANRYTIAHCLSRAGFQVWEAETGQRALELAEQRPDLIILDVNLPDFLGYDLCRMLKQDPKTAAIPVLEMSAAFRSSADRVKGLDSGADGYLTGPVDPEELLANVKLLLRLKESHEKLRDLNGELERRVEERTMELARANEQLNREMAERRRAELAREQLFRQLVHAQEDERRRISRELHDQMGQHATALALGLKALDRAVGRSRSARKTLQQLQQIADALGQDLHRTALELRPTALDDIGLVSTLRNYILSWSKRFKIRADFQPVNLAGGRLPPEIETTFYRLLQEALTNIVKHSKAKHVSVVLERFDAQAQMIIEDDGCGFDPETVLSSAAAQGRLGISGMRERLAMVAGVLTVESSAGCGTSVYARIPMVKA